MYLNNPSAKWQTIVRFQTQDGAGIQYLKRKY